ncbi:unnamed protein product [Rhizopus stolonifer]
MRIRSSRVIGEQTEQTIEQQFPPSPFGKKRNQSLERFVISKRHCLSKDVLSKEEEEKMKILAYVQSEVLNDPTAASQYTDLTIDVDSPYAKRFQTLPMSEVGRRILQTRHYERTFNSSPIKVLDAPDLQDDFYLNLMDWGVNDCLAIGLGSTVYLWNANTSQVTELYNLSPDRVTSVQWSKLGHLLMVGTHRGCLVLFDAQTQQLLRTWSVHLARISSLSWAANVLSSGGKSCTIYHHDIRSSTAYFRMLTGHTQEICGLRWDMENTRLASGSNDNHLMIWDARQSCRVYRFDEHRAAVKALSWSPHKRGLLVSGGGTADKTIKYWNTLKGTMVSSHDTGSQVCNLIWSKLTDEVVSSHGYANHWLSQSNQINIWKSNRNLGTLSGHSSRVLYMSLSPDGRTLVTGAADETLMFWDLFQNVHCCQRTRKMPYLR